MTQVRWPRRRVGRDGVRPGQRSRVVSTGIATEGIFSRARSVRGEALLLLALAGSVAAAPPAPLVVVSDDNYPPYLFRVDGQLRGILVDKWQLWSQRTGVPVRVEGTAWIAAQERVQS